MMHVHDLRMISSDEWRESLHASARWMRKTKCQSCLEEMHGKSETGAW